MQHAFQPGVIQIWLLNLDYRKHHRNIKLLDSKEIIKIQQRLVMKKILQILFTLSLFLSAFPCGNTYGADLIKDYIFIMDVSGSMVGKGDGRGSIVFPQMKKVLKEYITNEIPNGSVVSIITFAEEIYDTKTITVNNKDNYNELLNYIDNLVADGKSTDLYGTMDISFNLASTKEERPTIVAIFTDGRDNVKRKSKESVLQHLKGLKEINPGLYVIFYQFAFSDDSRPLPFSQEEIPGTTIYRDKVDFEKDLTKTLKEIDSKINNGLARMQEKENELKQIADQLKQKENLLDEQQEDLKSKISELQSKEISLSEEEETRKLEYERKLNSKAILL